MRPRLVLATLVLVALAATSGCMGFFGGGISDEQLDRQPPSGEYDWSTDADTTYWIRDSSWISGGTVEAVVHLNGTSTVELYREGIGSKQPLGGVEAVRYRYPNGTVVPGSELEVERTRSVVRITVPDANGTLAFTADADRKRFSVPVFVDGSHEVILPPGYRASNFLFGEIRPAPADTSVDAQDRLHVRWTDPNNAVAVRYYLQRDLYVFGGGAAVLGLIAAVGVLYYRRKIKGLEELRKEYGLDVDQDDEFDDGPPPGMG